MTISIGLNILNADIILSYCVSSTKHIDATVVIGSINELRCTPIQLVNRMEAKIVRKKLKNFAPQFLLNFSGNKHARGLENSSHERWEP